MRICSSLVAVIALVGSAQAATIEITGSNGPPGINGTSGDPATDGTDGGAGSLAAAVSTGPDASNTALATGRFGGQGGIGGSSSYGNNAGAGGAGGAGGEARARAVTDAAGPTSSYAQAESGFAGHGGSGGITTPPGQSGALGEGGAGGNADAQAASHSVSGLSTAQAVANAGSGATGGQSVDPNVPYSEGLGGAGGAASARAEARSDSGEARSGAQSRGGGGAFVNGLTTGAGGGATSSAEAHGVTAASAYATATAGAGGYLGGPSGGPGEGGVGGTAVATASAVATAGNATAGATQEAGAGGTNTDGSESIMDDAVSGSATGTLELSQIAYGGRGDAAGGAAWSVLHASNPGGGALEASSNAQGGSSGTGTAGAASAEVVGPDASSAPVTLRAGARGGQGFIGTAGGFAEASAHQDVAVDGALDVGAVAEGGLGGIGGNSYASANGIGAGSERVQVRATAVGGDSIGGPGGQAGHGSLGPVVGRSLGGGDVDVTGFVRGGRGPFGGAAEVENAVEGFTSGYLTLTQEARGGESSGGAGTFGGFARSDLEVDSGGSGLELNVRATGGEGGQGGNASVSATGSNAQQAIVNARAEGGALSFFDGTAGGSAVVSARAESASWAQVGTDDERTGAYGARGGGSARSRSEAFSSADGVALAFDRAAGGLGASFATGGEAWSSADASVLGEGDAGAYSEARGGKGGGIDGVTGTSGAGGQAHATAHATSLGSASARATQIGGDGGDSTDIMGRGGDSELVNAVSGSSPSSLFLAQAAIGGQGGRGGDARSVLDDVDAGGAELVLYSEAHGGDASAVGGNASAGATAIDHAGKDLSVDVTSQAGNGKAHGGVASLETVSGVSTAGGFVSVRANVFGGSGDVAQSVDLNDVVTGDTSGILVLDQSAWGGSSSLAAGAASSRLSRSGDFESLSLHSQAVGGEADGALAPIVGGAAHASAEADNRTGSAFAYASGDGGVAAYRFDEAADGSHGGDGDGIARAAVHAADAVADAVASGNGGGGATVYAGSSARNGGDGGDGTSDARAIHTGGGKASGSAFSVGGAGGQSSGDHFGGSGGDARSTAFAQGGIEVFASATARAGLLGNSQVVSPTARNGNAWANAQAIGDAKVSAWADAQGAGTLQTSARASTSGPVLTVRSELASGPPTHPLDPYGNGAYIQGAAVVKGGLATASYWQGIGIGAVNALPAAEQVEPWLDDSPNVASAVAAGAEVLALGVLGQHANSLSGELALDLDTAQFSGTTQLTFAFLDPVAYGSGLDALHLELTGNGQTLFEREFADLGSAHLALDDALYDLDGAGLFDLPVLALVLSFSIDVPVESGFYTEFALLQRPVAEPSVALLMAALAAFPALRGGWRRRGSRGSAPSA